MAFKLLRNRERGLVVLAGATCALIFSLSACSTAPVAHDRLMRSTASSIGAEIVEPETAYADDDPSSRSDAPSDSELAQLTPRRDRFMGRLGDGQPAGPSSRIAVEGWDGVTLSFDDASIEEVASAVLGDLLQADFTIDPSVSGRITLRSVRPVPLTDLPAAFDRSLSLAGARLIEGADGVYRILPEARTSEFARAPRRSNAPRSPGYGHVILPLQHVPAAEMARLLRPFAPANGVTLVDPARQILILSGDPDEIDVMLETASLFDIDWLAEMSFAVFELRHATPDALIGELNSVMGGPDGPVGSQLQFVPLPRLNSIVAIARNPARLDQAEEWIDRLDVRVDHGRRARVVRLVNADAERLAGRLNELFALDAGEGGTGIIVQADPDANALLIVADNEGHDAVLEVIAELDRAAHQVVIEATIAEVVLTDDLRYGVQWFLDTRDGGTLTSTGNAGGGVAPTFPGFAYTYASDYVRVALSAIASVTDVEVISTPQIMTIDNQTASLQVGDQVPVVTQSAVSISDPDAPIVNSVQFRDTGVVLDVTPRIHPDGMVTLVVSQEVSSVAETTTSGIDSPTIQQRRFQSTVSVRDGQTVALGGLIRSSRTRNQSGVPYLQDVPMLGALFRDNTDTTRRTELIIFLTPHVIRSSGDAAEATRALATRLESLRLSGFADNEAE